MTRIAGRFRPWRVVWIAAYLWVTAIGPAEAQDQSPPTCKLPVLALAEAAELLRVDASVLERLATNGEVPGRLIGTTWRFGCAALMVWLDGTGQRARGEIAPKAGPSSLSTPNLAEITAAGTTIKQADVPPLPPTSPSATNTPQAPIGEAPEERTAEDVFLRGQRVLLGPGDVVVDVGQFLARRDGLVLAPVGGATGLATVEQRALTTVLVGRVGIISETEVFAGTSYSWQHSRQFIGATTLDRSERAAFGATVVGIRRTFLRESVGRPGVIVTLSGQVPIDAVPAAVGAGVVLIKSVDPVVLFVNANYVHAFRQESGDTAGRFRSADAVDLSMGYGLGLNDKVAISMAVSGAFARTRAIDATTSRHPSVFNARFGLTAWLARGIYIEPSVSFGLTGPADTVALGVTLPYSF